MSRNSDDLMMYVERIAEAGLYRIAAELKDLADNIAASDAQAVINQGMVHSFLQQANQDPPV